MINAILSGSLARILDLDFQVLLARTATQFTLAVWTDHATEASDPNFDLVQH